VRYGFNEADESKNVELLKRRFFERSCTGSSYTWQLPVLRVLLAKSNFTLRTAALIMSSLTGNIVGVRNSGVFTLSYLFSRRLIESRLLGVFHTFVCFTELNRLSGCHLVASEILEGGHALQIVLTLNTPFLLCISMMWAVLCP
jgi:hypothetical protein